MKQYLYRAFHSLHILIRPLVVVWYSKHESHRVRVALTCRDHVLLVKTSFSTHHLAFPGGGVERGETGVGAAARELREETGIDLPQSAFRYVGQMRTTAPAIPFLISVYEAEVERLELPELTWLRKLEIAERQWVFLAEAPRSNQVISWYLKQG